MRKRNRYKALKKKHKNQSNIIVLHKLDSKHNMMLDRELLSHCNFSRKKQIELLEAKITES